MEPRTCLVVLQLGESKSWDDLGVVGARVGIDSMVDGIELGYSRKAKGVVYLGVGPGVGIGNLLDVLKVLDGDRVDVKPSCRCGSWAWQRWHEAVAQVNEEMRHFTEFVAIPHGVN